MNCGALWSDEEVRALIHVWGDDKIRQELDGALRNKPIFVSIAKINERERVQQRLVTMQSKNQKSERRVRSY